MHAWCSHAKCELQIYSLAWSPNGKRLASGAVHGQQHARGSHAAPVPLTRWLSRLGRRSHQNMVDRATWIGEPHAGHFAQASISCTALCWQVLKSERAELELKGHGDYVTALQWKPLSNSDVLASAASSDKDKSVRWVPADPASGTAQRSAAHAPVCIEAELPLACPRWLPPAPSKHLHPGRVQHTAGITSQITHCHQMAISL